MFHYSSSYPSACSFQSCPTVPSFTPSQVTTDIPQTDVMAEEQTWSCKCCQYEIFFDIENQLKQDHDKEHDKWKEYDWCFPYHVWIDRL